MEKVNLPAGYQTVMPYLIVDDAAGFLDFACSVFDGQEKMKHLREDSQLIMHGEVVIGESTIMFANATDQWAAQPAGLFIYVEDADKVYEEAIAAGAVTIMQPADQSYGRSAGVRDPFGNTWWITAAEQGKK